MRNYFFDPEGELPVVKAKLFGPKGNKTVLLVFDSGAGITQIHQEVVNFVGHSETNKTGTVSILGVTGPAEIGYRIEVDQFSVLGAQFPKASIAAIDFSKWSEEGFDGLLGWDLIKQFHFEMEGPRGRLKVFDQ